jgi:hypothetical protein
VDSPYPIRKFKAITLGRENNKFFLIDFSGRVVCGTEKFAARGAWADYFPNLLGHAWIS